MPTQRTRRMKARIKTTTTTTTCVCDFSSGFRNNVKNADLYENEFSHRCHCSAIGVCVCVFTRLCLNTYKTLKNPLQVRASFYWWFGECIYFLNVLYFDVCFFSLLVSININVFCFLYFWTCHRIAIDYKSNV